MLRSVIAALAVLFATTTAQAQVRQPVPLQKDFEVRAVSPAMHALHAPRTSEIRVTFNQPVRLASLSGSAFHVFGRYSGVKTGTVQLLQYGRVLSFTPDVPFSAGEIVTVNLARTVASVHGPSLARGFAWNFWTDSRASSGNFTQTGTLLPGDTPYGAHGGDIDGDGDLDLCIPNENTSDVSVYLNDGTGSYGAEATYGVGLHCSANEAADFDHDGAVDLVVSNIVDDDISVLLGNGDGTFKPQLRFTTGDSPRGVTVLDVDGDGDMDVVTANRVQNNLSLFINKGTGFFQPAIPLEAGVDRETGVVAADMNNDGVLDLAVIAYISSDVAVMLGDGDGGFTTSDIEPIGANPWMMVFGDVDGDGNCDIAAALAGDDAAGVVRGNGAGGLLPSVTYAGGNFPISIDLGDLNGDGMLDISMGCYSGGIFDLWENMGDGTMGNHTTIPAPVAGSCTVMHDTDGDGDIDLTLIDEIADVVLLYRQDG